MEGTRTGEGESIESVREKQAASLFFLLYLFGVKRVSGKVEERKEEKGRKERVES
jgi:hypothetical protein